MVGRSPFFTERAKARSSTALRPWICLIVVVGIGGLAGPLLHAQGKSLEELLELNMADLLKLQVVSALKEPGTINKVPATVRVITSDEIRDNGYFTLEDVLADLPGFQFRNILGFNSYAFMRGVPSQNNKILLLVDGIQINELNSGGFYAGGQFNLTNVDRIEVVYGPGSAIYGTNAISGIINVLTRDPKETQGGRDRLTVRVSDQGIGIRDEDLAKLFNPFGQIDMSSTKRYEGTGLGLYLFKKILTLVGGAISVKSEYGRGSTFTFSVPREWEEIPHEESPDH